MENAEQPEVVFFNDPSNLRTLSNFKNALDMLPEHEGAELHVVNPLLIIIHSMISSRQEYDKHCQVNINWIGNGFISEMQNFLSGSKKNKDEALISIFTSAYRFLCELEFSIQSGLSAQLSSVKNFVAENFDNFGRLDKSQLIFAEYFMPARILKNMINSPEILEIKSFTSSVGVASKMKEKWDEEISQKEARLNALESNIKNITASYNFVALSKGFSQLLDQKKKDKHWAFISMLLLGILMLLPVAAQIVFAIENIETIEKHKSTLIYILPAILTTEILIFYFFRVVLTHFNSLKAQILQLDLRVSLCQFIESYSEYASRIKANDKSALEKFEQMIFSGLVASEGDIPSTFDGIEQIGKIVSSLKS